MATSCGLPLRTLDRLDSQSVDSIDVQTPVDSSLMSSWNVDNRLDFARRFHQRVLIDATVSYYNTNRGFYLSDDLSGEGFAEILLIEFRDADGKVLKALAIGAINQSVYDGATKHSYYRFYADRGAFFRLCRRFGDSIEAYCKRGK